MKSKSLIAILLVCTLSCSTILTGCSANSINADAKGAVFGEEEISLGFLNFMAKYRQAVYDGSYLPMFGTDMWSQDLFGDGGTFTESIKNEVIEEVETLLALEANMEEYNVSLTDDENKKIQEVAKQFMEDNTKKAIVQIGATEEYVARMLTLQTIRNKMYNEIISEVDTQVSDEEAAQRTFSYVEIDKSKTVDEEGNETESTDDEKAEIEEEVKEFAKLAKEDFDQAIQDNGYSLLTHSYGKDDDSETETMDEAVINEANKLKEGEVSGVISTEKSLYVLRLDMEFDQEATDQKKESIISTRKSDHFTEICDKYKEAGNFKLEEDAWEKVKFDKLFAMPAPKEEDLKDEAIPEDENAEEEDAGEEENQDQTPESE